MTKESELILIRIQIDPELDLLMQEKSCSTQIQSNKFGVLYHNCDADNGASGSPLIQGNFVVGMHLGYSPKYKSNVAINLGNLNNSEFDFRNFDDAEFDLERFKLPKIKIPNLSASKEVKLCGKSMTVSVLMYAGCQTSLGAIPPVCALSAPTAGSSCAANVAAAAGFCGISLEVIREAALSCLRK